jgi:phytoene dehydrogenase-like protein
MSYDAIVIGAGPNGLTAAAVLAKRGRKVLVLESAGEIGGHTRAIEFAPGFRSPLDGDPEWVPPSVEDATGVRLRNRVPAAQSRFRAPFESSAEGALIARLNRFAEVLGALYQLTPPDIDTKSPGEVLPLIRVALRTRALGRKEMIEFLRVMPMSIQDLLDDSIGNERVKAAIASAAIRDLRHGPRSAGTTFNLLHNMVGASAGSFRRAEWSPQGPDAFAKDAGRVAREAGAEIRTGARVERITVREDAVAGVVVAGGEEIPVRTVVSTADPKRTLLGMVDPVWLDPEFMLAVKNIKMRGCAAFILYGTRELESGDSGAELSNVQSLASSTTALEKAADAAKYGEISEAPLVEIFSASARWPGMAPAGKSVLAARVQFTPYTLKSGEWDRATAEALEQKVTAAIAGVIPGFESKIEHRLVLSPRDLETRFGVTEGALTHGELTLDQILFMRPVPGWGHYEMPIRGLFLGGAGAHPGPGILGGAGLLGARAALRQR